MALIELEKVGKRYMVHGSYFDALKQVTHSFEEDSFTFVTGSSGAGKSTLFRLMAAMEPASYGTIKVGGNDLSALNQYGIASYRRHLGIVFQDPMLLTDRSVSQNIALALEVDNVPTEEWQHRIEQVLSAVKMSKFADHVPSALSVGQRQRVGLARALVRSPTILLADEPTGNLDPMLSDEMLQLLVDISKSRGVCMLVATHEVAMVERYCALSNCHRIHLEQGKLEAV